jgi:signal transduction histidine kinase
LSGALSSITYFSVRSSVLNQQESSLRHEAIDVAELLSGKLQQKVPDYPFLLASYDTPRGSQSLLYRSGKWYPSSPSLTQAVLPHALESLVVNSGRAAQQTIRRNGIPELVVGVPIRLVNSAYFQVFDLSDVSRTLSVLLGSLVLAAAVTTLGGALVGSWGASRALRPLHDAAQAALSIAGGRLDTRLESEDYADLAVLTSAFNRMADRLQERIEREVRFTSDVNHELRSPLTTLATSLSVLEARREELPDRSRRALDLLSDEVRRFRRLVDDLLEISRLDAGLGEVHLDEVTLGSLVEHTVGATAASVMIDMPPDATELRVLVDKRRFERIVANLLDNAKRYAGGATRVAVERDGGIVRFAVEDRGPGVPPEERQRIFDRFSRGTSGRRRGTGDGTGLGLAIVTEHARALGGRVFVEPNGARGARFVVELPLSHNGATDTPATGHARTRRRPAR